ncbi:hypothetical protein AU255_17775 [Methyloprofundus sedimenti]|uniref:Uncharacterized protein n=1 Tax=Methyloprofundus sedimenti TaxID=1420851 RepID=A0A1V8M1C0_9GAMM|nr:hypothetical protein [Methyloprofundus sedimenti]OQK15322.1 hypothetical protein AU255_17775 [Methyloprofundus sedimenti]
MVLPDITVSYDESFSSDNFNEFQQALAYEKLNIVVESRPKAGAFACHEWFIPTAIIVFIGKSYFDGFLKEMGKDHYQVLKNNLAELTNKQMSKPKIEPTIIGTQGKVSVNNPYSMAYSVYAEANDGNRFKLLIPKPSNAGDYTEIIYKFLEFLNDYHMGIKNEESIGFNMSIKPPSRLIFVHMNLETKKIEWLNHNFT